MTGPRHADRPEHVLHPDELEVAPGTQHETLQGWIPELATRGRHCAKRWKRRLITAEMWR